MWLMTKTYQDELCQNIRERARTTYELQDQVQKIKRALEHEMSPSEMKRLLNWK